MEWELEYVDRDDFKRHVSDTIVHYGEKLSSIIHS